ncbi:hypothetical protein NL108_012749, partial [Boleophthalmus pectinirostris]
ICSHPERQVLSPNITLYLSWEGDWDSQVKLTCLVSGFYPDTLKVSWTRDNHPFLDSTPIENKFKSPNGGKSFTLSSQIEPNMTEWENGSNFTCVALHEKTTYSKSINICKMTPKMPPAVDLETPSFQTVMTAESRVNATCTVRSVARTSVTWLLYPEFSAPQIIKESNSTHIISKLTLSPSQWETLFLLTCKAEHACLPPTEKSINISEPPASDPVVSIRRSLPDLLKGDRAVLECDITSVSSTDFYVTFQSNDVDISSKDFVQLPKGSGLHSISRRFSVPKDQWKNDQNFSCRVSYGFSTNFTSTPTGSIFVEPSVKLLLASDESGKQTLLCTAWGFDPHIQWLSGSQRISSGSNDSISVNAEGRVVVSSQLQVSQAEWKTGQVYTCQVSDKSLGKTVKENISVCAVTPLASKTVGIYIQGPPLEERQSTAPRLNVSCLLVGPSLDSFSVTWKVDEQIESGGVHTKAPVLHSNGTQTLESQLSLPAQDWNTHKLVTCEAKHLCSNLVFKAHTNKSKVQLPPTVTLTYPSLHERSLLDPMFLDCLVSGFYPPEVRIFWEKNGIRIPPSSQTNAPVWQDKDGVTYCTSSRLNISNTLDDNSTYACVVRHESSAAPFTETIGPVF